MAPQTTGVDFINQLRETEQENVLAFEYFYNGGGVAVGDLNNDGLADLFFTGNQADNALYLNQGDFKFENVTAKAGVAGRPGGWKTGVTLADVNADGWLDIYVCYSGLRPEHLRRNQLFINNGKTPPLLGGPKGGKAGAGELSFTDHAAEYGLDDPGYSVQATFFDYDLDGDLDCFLLNHNLKNYQRKEAAVLRAERDPNAGDKLFRNEARPAPPAPEGGAFCGSNGAPPSGAGGAGRAFFVDVSASAGIKGNPLGFGLGVAVSDLNGDSWPDLYVTNDYVEDDYLYINQRNGGFRDELRERVAHTSYSAMGVDVADLNNDARPDVFTLDMMPESNARQKTLPWPDNWNVYQAQLANGFWHQNMRNMLQIGQGNGQFAEVGQLAGVSATDWSWGALLADFDGDGFKDIFVSNGMIRDFTDADFIKYSDDEAARPPGGSVLETIRRMPSTRTKNFIFQNNGHPDSLVFRNQQVAWGFDDPTVANGCAYADLDGDGDLDLVTNNLNEPARIYRNTSRETTQPSFLRLRLNGPAGNRFGVGTRIQVEAGGQTQTQEFYPTRGFQSCSHGDLLFGFGNQKQGANVTVTWPDGKTQRLTSVALDQTLTLDYRQATAANATRLPADPVVLFTQKPAPDFTHRIAPVNNFDRQILLPMHYSYAGPRLAVGDANGDGQDDVFACGTPTQPGTLFLRKADGFVPQPLPGAAPLTNTDAVLADFNGDGSLDLYVVNGGYAVREPEKRQDQLWLNAGRGQFRAQPLPPETENGTCVKAADFDRDGDLDLFVGAHCQPFRFPAPAESFLLINDGQAHFTRQSLGQLGLVTDAAVLDTDRDGWPDLVLVGEWMPVTILRNDRGHFTRNSPFTIQNSNGWWNRIEKADLDGDGDDDLVLGNLGLNTQLRATPAEPATLVSADFDQNGTLDFFMSSFLGGKAYPAYSRDEMAEQVPALRKRFTTYNAFSKATLEDAFDPEALRSAKRRTLTELRTLVLENQAGTFVPRPLPAAAQVAPVYAILPADFDGDGRSDLLLLGNNSHLRLRLGKVDANAGLVLRNRGGWRFEALPPTESGLWLKGDVRDAKQVGDRVLVGVNDGRVLGFEGKKFPVIQPPRPVP